VKFDMGNQALSTLNTRTEGASDDLGALVRQLAAAAAPLEGRFNGQGRLAFDAFKLRADEIATELNGALRGILGGARGMDAAFVSGEREMADNSRTSQGAANFDAARFSRGS
jgi:uncharacterized protein YukE